jgi:hypothetical protein
MFAVWLLIPWMEKILHQLPTIEIPMKRRRSWGYNGISASTRRVAEQMIPQMT